MTFKKCRGSIKKKFNTIEHLKGGKKMSYDYRLLDGRITSSRQFAFWNALDRITVTPSVTDTDFREEQL